MQNETNKKSINRISVLCITAMLAAIVIVMTAYILHIPIGVASGGYIHLGDAFIFTAACMLPQPYALAVGAIGAGVADLLTAPIWAPASIVIKILITLPFISNGKMLRRRNVVAALAAVPITVIGYYFAEVILFGNWKTPLVSMPFNAIQAFASFAVFLLIAAALDKMGIRTMMKRFLYRQ
jgi:uncharacterized repeat protein (TIGR04002 family)